MLGGCVWVGFAEDFGNAHDFFVDNGMIEEDEVAFGHGAKVVSRLVVSDAIPFGLAFFDEVEP